MRTLNIAMFRDAEVLFPRRKRASCPERHRWLAGDAYILVGAQVCRHHHNVHLQLLGSMNKAH